MSGGSQTGDVRQSHCSFAEAGRDTACRLEKAETANKGQVGTDHAYK